MMESIRFYVDFLAHYLRSHSRHGTHSPFVYRLVDEVIYAPRRASESKDKVRRLIHRLIERFKPEHVYRVGTAWSEGQLDFVVAWGGGGDALERQLEHLWPQLHRQSVIVITDIYRGNGMRQLWQTIKSKPEVTVTVDLFHAGLVFFHAGQAKEDFRIRF